MGWLGFIEGLFSIVFRFTKDVTSKLLPGLIIEIWSYYVMCVHKWLIVFITTCVTLEKPHCGISKGILCMFGSLVHQMQYWKTN